MECDVGVFVFWLELCYHWRLAAALGNGVAVCASGQHVCCAIQCICVCYIQAGISLCTGISRIALCVYTHVSVCVCVYVITGKSSDWIPAKQLAFTGACASCCAWEWWRSARIAFVWAPERTVEQHCNSLLQHIVCLSLPAVCLQAPVIAIHSTAFLTLYHLRSATV